jgi:HlyD family secretion protein
MRTLVQSFTVRLGFVLVLLVSLPLLYARLASRPGAQVSNGQTAVAEQKDFARVLRLGGTTRASRSFIVTAPQLEGAQLNTLLITRVVASGAQIKPGDILVQFDPQAQLKDYIDKQKTYTELVGTVAQKQTDADIARAKDDTELEAAENALKKAELEVQRNEIVSRIDAEKNQESLEEAKATFSQLKETYQLKRKAAAATIRIAELQRDRAAEAMRYAKSNETKMTIQSPMEGVAVFNTIGLGGRMRTAQTGDSVESGVPFLQVVDPSKMEVRAKINQSDLGKVPMGQKATVRFDAYPGMAMPAVLTEISPFGEGGRFSEKIRAFTVVFSIQGSDPRLLPDLSAALDITLESQANATVIPRQSVGHDPGGDFVMMKSRLGFEKRAVQLGGMNDTEAVVRSGIRKGDIVELKPGEVGTPAGK